MSERARGLLLPSRRETIDDVVHNCKEIGSTINGACNSDETDMASLQGRFVVP